MRNYLLILVVSCLAMGQTVVAQTYTVSSPEGNIVLTIDNGLELKYSVSLEGDVMIAPSPMGFEFKGEAPMTGGFSVLGEPKQQGKVEEWTPVVANKHSFISVPYNELVLNLQEKDTPYRKMDLTFRVMNDGVAFRYTLYGTPVLGNREITREVTGFAVPEKATLRIPNFAYEQEGKSYKSSQEGEYVKTPVTEIRSDQHCGLPGLIEIDSNHCMAILNAALDNFPALYLGRSEAPKDGFQLLQTKLTPICGETEDGVKARFSEQQDTPWRVVMVGHHPGKFIESEILRSLNAPCAIEDPSWIKPGMSAWDHWWSGEVLMEQEVIKQYIDFASVQGWPYMLIDWTWYGPYATPEADIVKPAPQLDMPEILRYAKSKNVDIWLWLRCEDANHNDQYKAAFPLYHEWGVKGVKIDFMDRDDQDMVNWYRRVVEAAAESQLMVDFHGAYCPDGFDRTYPNLLTREGVMGSEYYKWSDRVTPEHNVTLAFTRLLAGQMDYTPGGFLNVTKEQFKGQSPALVMNTRSAELAKFVIFESPFMCFCDHPDHVLGQVGSDFVQIVPVVWDDIRFIAGAPDEYVALAKRSGEQWYVGVLNNSIQRDLNLNLSFLSTGTYRLEYWRDGKQANKEATSCEHKSVVVRSDKPLKLKLANAGGYVGIFTKVEK